MRAVALFKVASVALVWSAMRDPAWLGVLAASLAIGVHLAAAEERPRQLRAIALFAAAGLLCESALMTAGLVTFHGAAPLGPLCPPWVVLLWAALGTLVDGPLATLRDRPWLCGLLASVVAPLSFIGASAAGAITVARPLAPALAVVALAVGATFVAAFSLSPGGERVGVRGKSAREGLHPTSAKPKPS